MLIYTDNITPRLQYIVAYISNEVSNEQWELTSDSILFISSYKNKINYSNRNFDGNDILHIPPHGLLFENDIKPQQIQCTRIDQTVVFFQNNSTVGFDIFSASFHLLSRYEEYLPHPKDKHGRYAHENSLAFREGFLQFPLINTWLNRFTDLLQNHFTSFKTTKKTYRFLPTYDIDMAWSYRHKGFVRNAGGLLKDSLQFNFADCKKRLRVLAGKQPDPYYNFAWLDEIHNRNNLAAQYFFLVAEKRSDKDKNISPLNPSMKKLIKQTSEKYATGLHPSWRSCDDFTVLEKEKGILENITEKPIIASRQHYLRLALPQTYQRLIDVGIIEDYSMGYAGYNGFRASSATPFYWYDLQKEQATSVKIFPFCYMDATSVYYKNDSPQQALEELKQLHHSVKKVNGIFCTLFHNDTFHNILWHSVYESLVQLANK